MIMLSSSRNFLSFFRTYSIIDSRAIKYSDLSIQHHNKRQVQSKHLVIFSFRRNAILQLNMEMPVWTSLPTCSGSEGAVGATFAAALHFFAATQCLLQEPWPKQADVQNGAYFDFIIIGGGTAGSTLAARLSEDPSFSVLLVEAGADPPQESIIPGFKDAMKGGPYDWNFTTIDDHFSSQALRDGKQSQPRGKMLGGSGSINDMIYARGFPSDYEEWADLVGEEWRWENVLKYFKKTEHLTDERIVNDPKLFQYHRKGGEIEVGGLNLSTLTTERFLEAFQELGYVTVKDMTHPNYRLQKYAGRFSHTITEGRRDSSLTALLNKANGRENLFVLKEALVTKILIDNETAVGVQLLMRGQELKVFANREVIVSAGTFNTAKVLLLSGIGPSEHLNSLGLQVHQDLPVGENLHDHIMVLNYVAAESGTCAADESTTFMNMIQYFYDRTGTFSRTNSLGAYISTNTPYEVPDFALYPVCIPMNISFYDPCYHMLGYSDEICTILDEENKKHELLTLAVVLLKPKSRGRVKLNSTDPLEAPLIYSGTFSNVEDLEGYPEAMSAAWSIAETKYFQDKKARIIQFHHKVCENITEKHERYRCAAIAEARSAWHAVGTAAMGSVVDSRLNVYGIARLRVADASVMPKVIRGNTNAPVVMIAEQAADFIKEDYGVKSIK